MQTYLIIGFILYLLVLNSITSYRLYIDDGYDKVQKIVQGVMVWLIPLFGSMFVSLMINRDIKFKEKNYAQIPWIFAMLGYVFFVETPNENISGYDPSMNDYSAFGDGDSGGGDGGGGGD